MTGTCSLCKNEIIIEYKPMDEWKLDGNLCGECYSQKLDEFYPGKHVRTNRLDNE